jgi:GNAT superfamily N-acetyltransferase
VTLCIRSTRPDDARHLPAIERSAGQLFLALPDLAWIAGAAVMDEARHQALIAAATSWVACDEAGERVGFLAAEIAGETLHIWEISVHADAQGKGVGRTLIEHAARNARARGLQSLTLTTFRDVAWNEPYYQRLGFETLASDALGSRLAKLLEEEAAHSLPPDRRCAMRRALALAPGAG